jgi:hypothetical protein
MTVSPVTPDSLISAISFSGMPLRPNPPAMIVMPSCNSPASAALGIG